VVAVEDYGEVVILPRFVDWLSGVAPQVRIRIRPEPSASLKAALKDGAVDMALDYYPVRDPDYVNRCVMTETLLTLARRDHPLIGDKLNLESFLALGQVVIAPRPDAMPLIDVALAKRGLQRHVAVTVPHFMSMPLIVQSSTMIATLPRRMALLYAEHFRLRAHAMPLRTPQLPVYLIWHTSTDSDPGHQWFRNQLIDLCQRL
jgi:DNA-binding transcriptional LysR family regulator